MRITFWTTCSLEPAIEAVSKEVEDLRSAFPGSRVISMSPHLSVRVDWKRKIFGIHPSLDPMLRVVAPVAERLGDVNHVYAESEPWLYAKLLKRRPTVFTIASEKGQPRAEFIGSCKAVVVQTAGMQRYLETIGASGRNVHLIYPGIDLGTLKPRAEPRGSRRPRIFFATFPRSREELEARGVLFLLEAARALPDVEFTLLSRPWKTGETASRVVRELVAANSLRNVNLIEGVQSDMSRLYNDHDFCVIPYVTADGGKECPRSLIESMACAIPVLISSVAPFSYFVEAHACGAVYSPTIESFAETLERALINHGELSANALHAAHRFFDRGAMLRRYAEIYASVVR